MRFERLLKVYWARFLLYGSNTYPPLTPLHRIWWLGYGLGKRSFLTLTSRLEANTLLSKNVSKVSPKLVIEEVDSMLLLFVNQFLSFLQTINHDPIVFSRTALLRKYLIRTFRGRRYLTRKPSHGQRTRSNAKTSRRLHSILDAPLLQFRLKWKKLMKIKSKRFDPRLLLSKKKIKKRIKKWHQRAVAEKYKTWF